MSAFRGIDTSLQLTFDGIFHGLKGDLPVIVLLVALIAIAWYVGILTESAARRGLVAGVGVALVTLPVVVWLQSEHALPGAIWIAAFYGPTVAVTFLVWKASAGDGGGPRLSLRT